MAGYFGPPLVNHTHTATPGDGGSLNTQTTLTELGTLMQTILALLRANV